MQTARRPDSGSYSGRASGRKRRYASSVAGLHERPGSLVRLKKPLCSHGCPHSSTRSVSQGTVPFLCPSFHRVQYGKVPLFAFSTGPSQSWVGGLRESSRASWPDRRAREAVETGSYTQINPILGRTSQHHENAKKRTEKSFSLRAGPTRGFAVPLGLWASHEHGLFFQ